MEVLSHDPYAVMMHKVFPKYYFRSTWSSSASAAVVKSSVSLASLELEAAGLSKMSHEASDPRPGSTYRIVAAINKARKSIIFKEKVVIFQKLKNNFEFFGKLLSSYMQMYVHTSLMIYIHNLLNQPYKFTTDP